MEKNINPFISAEDSKYMPYVFYHVKCPKCGFYNETGKTYENCPECGENFVLMRETAARQRGKQRYKDNF